MNTYVDSILSYRGISSPADVLSFKELSCEQKISLLRQWNYDALEREVAADEGMPGTVDTHLDEIHKALHQLDAAVKVCQFT